MKKRLVKIKIAHGYDGDKMLARKLIFALLKEGQIKTTIAKAHLIKPLWDRLAHRSEEYTQANKNVLLKKLGDKKLVKEFFDKVGSQIKKNGQGFIKMKKIGQRPSDGSLMVNIGWNFKMKNKKVKIKKKNELTKMKK